MESECAKTKVDCNVENDLKDHSHKFLFDIFVHTSQYTLESSTKLHNISSSRIR